MKSKTIVFDAKLETDKYPIYGKSVRKAEAQSYGSTVVKYNYDRQAAEDHSVMFSLAGLVNKSVPFFLLNFTK